MGARILLGLTFGALLVAGCATEPSGRTYGRNETRTAYDIVFGEVIDVQIVTIEGDPGIIGTWGGASVGRAIERKIREDEALEITVQLDGAEAIAVVQTDDVEFAPGDRVRVLFGRDGSARVAAL